MALDNGGGNSSSAKAHVKYQGEEDVSQDDPSIIKRSSYDIEPIGYFDFLVKLRNRIVEDSISIRLTGDQVRGVVDGLQRYTSGESGVGVMLMVTVDDSKSSMLYQDGIAIQDFVIKIDSIVPLEDSRLSSDDQDASGQLMFDWS